MGDITVTAAIVADIFPDESEKFSGVLAQACTQGQALAMNTAGAYILADANAGTRQQFRGIALEEGGIDHTIDIMRRGTLEGYTLTALGHNDAIYLSDTAGALATTASGTMSILVGRVVAIADGPGTLTKAVYIFADWLRAWA